MEQVPGCLIDSNQMNVNGNDRHIIAWITGQLYAMTFVTEQKTEGFRGGNWVWKQSTIYLNVSLTQYALWYFSIVSKIPPVKQHMNCNVSLEPLPCPPVLTMCADPELDIWQKVMILSPTVNVNSWLFSVNAYHTLGNLMADFQ